MKMSIINKLDWYKNVISESQIFLEKQVRMTYEEEILEGKT